ncbi:hypothetical protein [uncultured Lamprocystis sp.]|jgi:HEPN domain-containing protein|uniref:hypothetical protein n=1 Tax=uncultured Lamprocystis sp. TaxID=543132 RepID=UPI0025E0A022|nr:hypothetical protein [uncultured Lamprocystis sp.]
MGKVGPQYTRQSFFDAARRRVREARVLLDHPTSQKQRDGAVTMALVAAECALKAALLQGHQVNSIDDLWGGPVADLFKGKKGHDLLELWRGLPAPISAQTTAAEDQAMICLNGADTYLHRYGVKKPRREHAEPLVKSAERLVAWMNHVVT